MRIKVNNSIAMLLHEPLQRPQPAEFEDLALSVWLRR